MAVKEIGYNMMEWHDHSSSNTYFEKTHLQHYEVTKYDNELTKCRKVFSKYGHEFTANLHDPCIGGVRNGSVGKIDTPDFLQALIIFLNFSKLFWWAYQPSLLENYWSNEFIEKFCFRGDCVFASLVKQISRSNIRSGLSQTSLLVPTLHDNNMFINREMFGILK